MSVSNSTVPPSKEKDSKLATTEQSKYVPGLGHVPLKPKSKKKKNKSNLQGLGATGPTINLPDAAEPDSLDSSSSDPIKTNDNEPVALLDHAPAQNELPKNLVADNDELEDAIKQETNGSAPRGKSPAEEMVAKRIRLLNKKIQRFRSYRDGTNLNADQKAGLASLPVLEGNMKELEEVAKALEGLAEEHTGNEKKIQEKHRLELETVRLSAVEDYKKAYFPLLTALVQTYTTLHPSTPGMANFMAPELPSHLQDLSREDVANLDSLYDKIASQGVEAVIEELKSTEEKRLLQILSQQPAEDDDVLVFSPPKAVANELPTVDRHSEEPSLPTEQKAEDVSQSMEAFRYEPEVADLPAKEIVYATPATTENQKSNEMSFMQSSELAPAERAMEHESAQDGPDLGMSAGAAQEEMKGIEPEAKEPEVSAPPAASDPFSQPAILNWADDDEVHSGEDELAKIRAQFNMPPAAAASIAPALAEATASALPSQFIAPSDSQGAQLGSLVSQAQSQTQGQRQRQQHQQYHQQESRPNRSLNGQAGNSGNWRRNGSGQSGENTPGSATTNPNNRSRGNHAQQLAGGRDGVARQEIPRERVEDDGFQVATKRRGPPNQGAPGSGFRGRPSGGRGGGGNGRGRGGGDSGARGGYAARRDVNSSTA